MNINIIGNGFDMYHGLPSSYYYFGCYLINNDYEFYEQIGYMYDFNFRKVYATYPDLEFDYTVDDIFWRDFEKQLGEVNEGFVVGTTIEDLGLENDDPVDIDVNDDIIAERLKKYFIRWVKETLDVPENYRIIKRLMKKCLNKVKFGSDDYFLVFNYTHTLQKVYRIPNYRIHYVHGECTGNDNDELIFGHGNVKRISEIKKKLYSYKDEDDYVQTLRNEKNENECLLRYIERLKKNVPYCIDLCEWFYKDIGSQPEDIYVYGMSLGEVDIPYILQLKERWPHSYWHFSYYSESDIDRIKEIAAKRLKLGKDQYSMFEFVNPQAESIKRILIEQQNIKEFNKA